MSTEHNPIAQLISQIQQKWNDEASPEKECRLVRWLIKPDQARLYEGFLRLESTANGSIPEMLIVLLCPFKDPHTFSKTLAEQWIKDYLAETKSNNTLKEAGLFPQWDAQHYQRLSEKTGTDHNKLLLEMLSSFQNALPDKETRLALALMPYTISAVGDYGRWMENLLKLGIPDKVLCMVFDYEEEQHFDDLFRKQPKQTKSLYLNLDLDGAINKLAKSGDPNSPEVQLKECIIEMSNAVKTNSLDRLHKWGKKGLEITQRTGNKAFYASAHLLYAGMLFQFSQFEEIEQLLKRGLAMSMQLLKNGDDASKPLIVQFYSYRAACCQHKKQMLEAADLFAKQGDLAMEFKMGIQALTAWWQAYTLYKKKEEEKCINLMTKAYAFGISLQAEELKTSCMSYIGFDYFQYCENLKQQEKCKEIDTFMKGLEGENWKTTVAAYKKDMQPKKRFVII